MEYTLLAEDLKIFLNLGLKSKYNLRNTSEHGVYDELVSKAQLIKELNLEKHYRSIDPNFPFDLIEITQGEMFVYGYREDDPWGTLIPLTNAALYKLILASDIVEGSVSK